MTLAHENGGDARFPDLFYGAENTDFVIDQHIMLGGTSFPGILQFFFLVHVNEHAAGKPLVKPRAKDFVRLKHHVAIRKYRCLPPLLDVLHGIERIGIETVGKRILQQKVGDRHQMLVVRMVQAITLQRAEIIRVAQLGAQRFENLPVNLSALLANFRSQMGAQIGDHLVVVQQGVVHVEQKNSFCSR